MIRRTVFPAGTLWLAFSMALFSCSKHDAAHNNCITRATPRVTDIIVSSANLDTIYSLFHTNHLSNPHIQFNGLHTDRWLDSNSQLVVVRQVTANYFVNGLPVFGSYLNYTFVNDRFVDSNCIHIAGIPENSDTIPQQSLMALNDAFYKYNPDYSGPCLQATLSYLDVSGIPGRTSVPMGRSLVKVWTVGDGIHFTPKVFVVDETGQSFPLIVMTLD
jgi:hypothetical protein